MPELDNYQYQQLTAQGTCYLHMHPAPALDQSSLVTLERAAEPAVVSTSRALTMSDEVILSDPSGGTITLTLPLSSNVGFKEYRISQVTTGTTVIARTGTDTITGATSISITTRWDSRRLKATAAHGWVTL
jgi:hypothetical protein